jgi:MFS family permease
MSSRFDNAFLGGTLALPAFRRQFHLEGVPQKQINDLSSNIVITFQAGCFLACFIATPIAEIMGRRKAILIASTVFAAGAALQLIGNLPSFYVGRFLTGLGVGPITVVAPIFLAEIAPATLRGRCIGFFEMMYQFGM